MSAIIARHNGDFMIKSTETGQLALVTAEEWAALVRRIKSGHLDYTLPDGKLTQASAYLSDVLREQIAADVLAERVKLALIEPCGVCGFRPSDESGCPWHRGPVVADRHIGLDGSGADRDGETPPGGPIPDDVQGLAHERGASGWTS